MQNLKFISLPVTTFSSIFLGVSLVFLQLNTATFGTNYIFVFPFLRSTTIYLQMLLNTIRTFAHFGKFFWLVQPSFNRIGGVRYNVMGHVGCRNCNQCVVIHSLLSSAVVVALFLAFVAKMISCEQTIISPQIFWNKKRILFIAIERVPLCFVSLTAVFVSLLSLSVSLNVTLFLFHFVWNVSLAI